MLALVQAWDPLAMLDLHATDGAQFQHDISITGEPIHTGDEALQVAGRALRDGIIAKLSRQGSQPVDFYPSFEEEDDPASGFSQGVSPPRFSHGYFQLRNRLAILVETHSWRTYPERVRATYNTVLDAMELVGEHGPAWLELARQADARAARLGGQPYVLGYRNTDAKRFIAFEGYAYTRTPSEVSGASMTRYDERTPQRWMVPMFDTIVPDTTITAPRGGYIVPPEYADDVARQLDIHGVAYRRLTAPRSDVVAQVFQADSVKFSPASVEGHQRATITGAWQPATVEIMAGALFVPVAQAKARLLMHVLEPQAGDSMAAWGRFQQRLRAQGIHGGLRHRGTGAADAGARPGAEGRLRKAPEGRPRLRRRPAGAAGLLLPPASGVGCGFQPLSGAADGRGAGLTGPMPSFRARRSSWFRATSRSFAALGMTVWALRRG